MKQNAHLLRQLFAASLLASSAIAQGPPLLTTGVEVSSSNARTTLVRTTGKLSSVIDVKVKNTSDRPLEAPLHAVVTFTPSAGGTLTGLTTTGLTGALAQPPYQTFYKDLSATIGSGLAVNAETTFSFTFDRPSSATITYAIAIRGIRNTDPVASIGGPYSAGQNTPVSFDASASSDPDGETLTYAWDFGDGTTATGATPQHSYAIPGLYTARVTVTDPRLGSSFRETEVPIVPAGVFALARTRTLDGNGHPLGGVSITQTGPGGTAQGESDAISGFTSLGGEPGDHAWVFSKPGHLTTHRKATLSQGSVKVVAFPWLAQLSTQRTPLSALNPTAVKSSSEKVTLTVPPGAFEQIESLAITDLHGQNLPLPLPHGWSPLAAFHLDMATEASANIAASVKLLQSIAAAKTLVLARCDTTTVSWTAQSVFNGNDTDLASTTLRKPGSYAIVIADELPAGNPVAAVTGEALPAGTAAVVAADVSAIGKVNPTSSLASTDPAKVTATATVDFTNGTQPLPSGAWFLAEVEETYDLRDGRALKTPDYDATFYAYQTPGDALAPTATATFPMRPRVLFSPAELSEANIHVRVHALNPFSGGIITAEGGFLTLPGIKVSAPAGAVTGPSAAEARLLSITTLNRFLGSFVALSAFDLNLPRLTDGTVLNLTLTNKFTPNTNFVLARCVSTGNESGLQPVLRMASDAQGTVTSIEPTIGPRLPGLTGSGQYVLVQLDEPEALITGLVRRIGGALLSGGIVRVTDEPWLSLTSSTGTFFTLAEPGSRTVTGSDPADGNSGQATATLADASAHTAVEIQTAPTGPKVLATTPVAGEPRASLVAPITIEFSEPIQPATFAADGLRLRGIAANLDVPGSVTLELSNRRASFFPTNPLAFATDYEIVVSSAIRDLQNLPIEGTLTFAFKTQPSDARPAGAQLVIYEPDADNIPPAVLDSLVGYDPAANLSMVVASGSPGTTDPEVPVILVNETTGETATVLSKPDGSFANFIEAGEADFISATFVNVNGTRISIPATRQLFDNGRVGLYRPGGILEAESEDRRVQVIVEPGAVPSRTKFTVDVLAAQQLQDLLGGTQPEAGGKVLSGVRYVEEGEPVTSAVDVAIDLKLGDLPAGVDPSQATFALTVPVEIEGRKGFQIIDSMSFEPGGAAGQGRLVTHSPPFMGVLLRQLNYMRAKAPFRDTLSKAHTAGFDQASSHSAVSAFLVGVMVAPIVPQTVGGFVVSAAPGINPEMSTKGVSGALVRFEVGLGAIDTSDPGLFRAGECFTMTAEDGSFAITRPNAFNRQIIATHPRFPFQRATSTGIAAGVTAARMKLYFREMDLTGSAADGAAPVLEIVQTPLAPRVGDSAENGAVLEVTAIDDVSISAVNATRLGFESFSGEALELTQLLSPVEIGPPVTTGVKDRRKIRVQALRAGRATIRVSAMDGVGNITSKDVAVAFGAGGGSVNTKHRLAFAWPRDKSEGVAIGAPINLRVVPAFTQEMVDDFTTWLSTSTQDATITSVDFSSDRREATVHYRITGTPVDLTLGFNGQYFDQRGGGGDDGQTSSPPTYMITFAPERALSVTGTQVVSGAGAVTLGRYSYALDRNNGAGRLLVYELQDDGEVAFEDEENLDRRLGRPNDIVLIPSYALQGISDGARTFRPDPSKSADENKAAGIAAASQAGAIVEAASYIAIVGGDPTSGSWLQVFKVDASDGSLEGMLTGGAVPLTTGNSLIVGIKWDAPFLGVQEIAAGTTSVRLINFNRLVNGFELMEENPDLLESLPNDGIAGIDLDNDGAFVSVGERAPLPGRHDGLIFGTEFTWAPISGDQRITDFAFHGGSGLLAVTFRQVGASPASGLAMILGGTAGLLDPDSAQVSWALPSGGQEAKRLLLLTGQRYFKADGTPAEGDLALISTMAGSAPQGRIVVVDVSNPAQPNSLGVAVMPVGSGTLNTLVKRADGLVAASLTTGGIILVDPALLLMPPPTGSTESPAIVRALPALVGGGQRTFSTEPAGVHFTANGGPMQAAHTAPLFRIVNFEHAPFKVDDLRSGSVGTGFGKVAKMVSVLRDSSAARTASVFDPANADHHTDPVRHHYVLIDAPGVVGETLPMVLAAIDSRGLPYVPEKDYLLPGILGYDQITAKYAVVTALNLIKYLDVEELAFEIPIFDLLNKVYQKFTVPDYPDDLMAKRLSDEPANPLYNMYLAGPFVLPTRDLKNDEMTALNNDVLPRRFLAAASALWAGLGPDLADDSLLKPFAARQDESISADWNIGLNLNTLFALADITEGIGAALGSGGSAAVPAAALIAKGLFQLVDFSLERVLQPAVTVYAHVGKARRPPLIFVPGIMGSEMVDDTSFTLHWAKLSDVLGLNQGIARLELGPDGNAAGNGLSSAPKDVLRYVGQTLITTGKDVGGSLIDHLVKEEGYRAYDLSPFDTFEKALTPSEAQMKGGPNLFPFAYDWRQDNALSAAKLARYVRMIFSFHPDAESVDVVAHSMGGLVTRRFILDHPNVVGRFISVASPFLGAPKAINTKKSGSLDDSKMNFLVKAETSQKLSRYNKALDQLFPSKAGYDLGFLPIWEDGADLDGDGFCRGKIAYGAARNFLDSAFFPAVKNEGGAVQPAPEPMKNNADFHTEAQDNWATGSISSEHYHIVGLQYQAKTISALRISPDLEPVTPVNDVAINLPPVDFFENESYGPEPALLPDGPALYPEDETKAYKLRYLAGVVRGAGDGTVPLLSAARGAGATGNDLNARNAVVFPVASTSDDDDELTEHVPVLVNPATKRWITRILSGKFRKEELPVVTISGPNPATALEGEMVSFTANSPSLTGYQGLGEPHYQWDLGDGRIIHGRTANVGYPDNGKFVITCTATYGAATFEGQPVPKGTSGLSSFALTVTNAAPQPSIAVVPTSPAPGQDVEFFATVGDPGVGDQWELEWDFGDGSSKEITSTRVVTHRYAVARNYNVTVKVKDDEGATGTSEALAVIVTTGNSVAASGSSPSPPSPVPPPSAGQADPLGANPTGLQMADILIGGIDDSEEHVRVFHDSKFVIGPVDGSVELIEEGGSVARLGVGSVHLAIYREVVMGGPPQSTQIKVRARPGTKNVTFYTRYFQGDGQARLFYHELVTTMPGDDVTLTLQWDQLLGFGDEQAKEMTVPKSQLASASAFGRRADIVLTAQEAPASFVTILARNADQRSGGGTSGQNTPPPPAEPSNVMELFVSHDLPTKVDGTPIGSSGPEHAPYIPPEGTTYVSLPPQPMHSATAAADTYHGISRKNGDIDATSKPPQKKKGPGLTIEEANQVRGAVKSVFTRNLPPLDGGGGGGPVSAYRNVFGMFVLELADVFIFEQGTGACLWKGDAALSTSAYTKGKSDNDYELFFPLFKSPSRIPSGETGLNATLAADRASFARCAHFPELMAGDWYFKLPHGAFMRDGELFDMGPVPEEEDADVRATYLKKATHWIYDRPSDAPLPIGGNWADANGFYKITRPSGGDALFHHPLTPAQVISFILTQTVNDDAELKKILPDISFFPFRREHFDFAVMSLEKPPPFGDDPIGDAGMGRSSLLLKWVLEGAFLPEFNGFNVGMNQAADMARRTAVYNRLVARRAEAFLFDAEEWALFQEYAILNESADLRVRLAPSLPATPGNAESEPPKGLFGDYLTAHDEKVMKKGGKAAIRALFAHLVSTEDGRDFALSITPQAFADDPITYRSFEHFIAERVKQRGLPPGVTRDDVDDFLGAKVANDDTFKKIRSRSGGVDAFLNKSFCLLNQLQFVHAENFALEAEVLRTLGRVDERRARLLNVHAVEQGFDASGAGGEFRPGRREMHGAEGSHHAHYDFIITLHNRARTAVGPLDLFMSTASNPLCTGINLNADDDSLTIPNKERLLAHDGQNAKKLRYQRAVNVEPTLKANFSFSFTGASTTANTVSGTDTISLQSYFLDLDSFDARELSAQAAGRRIYYRSVVFTETDYSLFRNSQLSQNTIIAPFHIHAPGTTFAQRSEQVMTQVLAEMLAGRAPQGFTTDDIAMMSTNETLAVYHQVPTISNPFIGVSTSDDIMVALRHIATQQPQPNEKRYLLVIEMPEENPGIEYARLAATTANGERVLVPINRAQSEIVFLDHLDFDRCDVYEVSNPTGPFSFTLTHRDTFTAEP
jgi:PKD repeat protein/pimeloyl-ACP methyl ester carboxylesterase